MSINILNKFETLQIQVANTCSEYTNTNEIDQEKAIDNLFDFVIDQFSKVKPGLSLRVDFSRLLELPYELYDTVCDRLRAIPDAEILMGVEGDDKLDVFYLVRK